MRYYGAEDWQAVARSQFSACTFNYSSSLKLHNCNKSILTLHCMKWIIVQRQGGEESSRTFLPISSEYIIALVYTVYSRLEKMIFVFESKFLERC